MCSNVRIVVIVGCALLALAMATPGQAVLIHQWNLDDGPPATTVAPTVGGITGTINGSLTWQAPGPPSSLLPAYCLSNAGGSTADYVDFGTDASTAPENITVAFWAKAQEGWYDPSGVIMVSKWSKDTGQSWEVGWGHSSGRVGPLFFRLMIDGGQHFVQGSDPDWFDVNEFDDGKWHHFAATFDGSSGSTYVDGNLIASVPISGTLDSSAAPLRLFQRDYPVYEAVYGGLLGGPLLIYDNALSGEEIAELATPIPEPSTITLLAVLLAGLGIAVSRRRG